MLFIFLCSALTLVPLRPDSRSCRPSLCPLDAARDFQREQHQAWPSLFLAIDTKAAKNFTVTSSTMMTFLRHVPLHTYVNTCGGACVNTRIMCSMCFPSGTSGKESACQCRRQKRCGFDPWGRKIPGGGNGNPLQYPCLENPMDRGAWWATVHGVTESDTAEAT